MATAPRQHRARSRPIAQAKRPSWWKWYYTEAWKRMSRARIKEDGWCRRCKIANDPDLVCDHIVEHNGNSELFWSYENTQCLCRACNTRKRNENAKRSN